MKVLLVFASKTLDNPSSDCGCDMPIVSSTRFYILFAVTLNKLFFFHFFVPTADTPNLKKKYHFSVRKLVVLLRAVLPFRIPASLVYR